MRQQQNNGAEMISAPEARAKGGAKALTGALCLLAALAGFGLPLLPGLADVWVFKLWIPLAIADVIFTAALYIAAYRVSGTWAAVIGALCAAAAFATGSIPSGLLAVVYALGAGCYALFAAMMRAEDFKVRIAAPLFGKFMVTWLGCVQILTPLLYGDSEMGDTVRYMLTAPHVVTCLVGSAVGVGICALLTRKQGEKSAC